MKLILIPIAILLLFIHSGLAPIQAKEPSGSQGDAAQNDDDDDDDKEKGDEEGNSQDTDDDTEENGSSPSPSPTGRPVTPTPSVDVVIKIPPIVIPILGGSDKKDEKKEERPRDNDDDDERPTPTPTVSARSVKAPVSVQQSQRQRVERTQTQEPEEETPVAAVVTKPIDPPLALVRGAVKGSFYNTQELSQSATISSMIASLTFMIVGVLLIKGNIVTYFVRRGRRLPLPQSNPITIPYVGARYKLNRD